MVDFPKPNEDGSCYFTAEQMALLNKAMAFLTADPKGAMLSQFFKTPLADPDVKKLSDMARFVFSAPDTTKLEVAKVGIELAVNFQRLWYNTAISNAFDADCEQESDYIRIATSMAIYMKDEIGNGNLLGAMVCMSALKSLQERHPQFHRVRLTLAYEQPASIERSAEDVVNTEMPAPVPVTDTYTFTTGTSTTGVFTLGGLSAAAPRTFMAVPAAAIIHDEVAPTETPVAPPVGIYAEVPPPQDDEILG